MKSKGALPSQMISDLVSQGMVQGASVENIRPASLDLVLTDEVYRVNGTFLPSPEETVHQALVRVGARPMQGERKLLERGMCYVVKLAETIVHFPRGVYAFCNPKSSSGRVDVHVRLLVDNLSRYDVVKSDYVGPLWLLVVPKAFSVEIVPGLSLNQMRFFDSDTRLSEMELELAFGEYGGLLSRPDGNPILYKGLKHSDHDGSILLTLGLQFPEPGFKAIETAEPIDLSQIGQHDPRRFFRPIEVQDEAITLQSGAFYILSTAECVQVPPQFACEMRPMDERSGDLRSHYAGFIDPGWGVKNLSGRLLTLEVRSFDTGIIVTHGQPIAKIRYERMIVEPAKHYDEMNPTYGDQAGPQLAKYFSKWK